MGELIQFPTGEIITREKTEEEIIRDISESLVEISQHLFDIIDDEIDAISKHDVNLLVGIDLRDETYRESRDAFVVVNLLYALLSRYVGMEHSLHKDLDSLYIKIKAMNKKNDIT
jgi:hypothetical protein